MAAFVAPGSPFTAEVHPSNSCSPPSGQNESHVGGDISAGPQEIGGGDGVRHTGLGTTVNIAIAAGSGALALVLVVLCIMCRRRRRRRKQAELGGATGLQMNPAALANRMAESAPDGGGNSAWNTDTYALEDRVPPGQAWMETYDSIDNQPATAMYDTANDARGQSSYDIIDNGRQQGVYVTADDPHAARTYDVIDNGLQAELYAIADSHAGPIYESASDSQAPERHYTLRNRPELKHRDSHRGSNIAPRTADTPSDDGPQPLYALADQAMSTPQSVYALADQALSPPQPVYALADQAVSPPQPVYALGDQAASPPQPVYHMAASSQANWIDDVAV